MHLTFTSAASSIQILKIGCQDDIRNNDFQQFQKGIIADWGSCDTKQLCFNGVSVCMLEIEISTECKLVIKPEKYHWILAFILSGDLEVDFCDNKRLKLIAGNYYTLNCLEFKREIRIDTSGQIMLIALTDKFMQQLLSPKIIEGISYHSSNIHLLAHGSFLNTRMQPILMDIMDDGKPDYIRRILIEAKILELLSMQLHQTNDDKTTDAFSEEDVKRLNEARQTVAANLQTPCSLIDLARRTGLNDFKLKKGFKALFGQTVFGYLNELRMETAYNYLQAGKTVGEVAELVGYKNAHHFTAAFKKKFSFLPSQVTRSNVNKPL